MHSIGSKIDHLGPLHGKLVRRIVLFQYLKSLGFPDDLWSTAPYVVSQICPRRPRDSGGDGGLIRLRNLARYSPKIDSRLNSGLTLAV